MEKNREFFGYGDNECMDCKLVRDPHIASLCWLMVFYATQQIAVAKAGDLDAAIIWEGKQNDVAGEIGCMAGMNRM